MKRPAGRRRILTAITILAIAVTLSGCGRYGSPVRMAPAAGTNSTSVEDDDVTGTDENTDRKTDQKTREPSDRSSEK